MPQVITLQCIREVAGIAVRTNNASEMNIATAKIPSAWQQLHALAAPGERVAFGVYTDYESDHRGDYTLVAGFRVAGDTTTEDLTKVVLPAGTYLVFEGKGAMPDVVIETWRAVWEYFAAASPLRRTYRTDFEEYAGEDTVRIYVGVRPASAG